MYPDWALLPVVILAAMATIIASQAVITGAYSLTRQAIQLRLLPRLKIRHTWETQEGQIYLASVNTLLLVAVLALVLGFGSSSDLASAYGISVTGTMVATAILALIVVHRHWGWPLWAAVALMHSLKHVKSLHDQNVILTVVTAPVPRVDPEDRVSMDTINARFRRVTLTFGYMEDPDVPQALALCRTLGWSFNIMTTSFLLSRRTLKLSSKSALPGWQSRLFIVMARNATGVSDYFHIPAGRVDEIGTQVNL